MKEFSNELRELLALNRIDAMVKRLLKMLSECESKSKLATTEINEIRTQVILLSARSNEINSKINKGVIDHFSK